MSSFADRSFLGLAVAICVVTVPAAAQKAVVERFTVDEGLPTSGIIGLEQDPAGRLWIANRAAITVYDGRRFHSYPAGVGLPKDQFRTLAIGAEGRVWTATWTGPVIAYLEGRIWHSLPPPAETLSAPRATSAMDVIGSGERPTVVVGTVASGLWIWHNASWTELRTEDGLPSDRIDCLTTYAGTVVVGTESGICQLVPDPDGPTLDCRLRDLNPRLAGPIFGASTRIGDDGRERLWLLGKTWVGVYEDGKLTMAAEGFELDTLHPALAGAVAEDRFGGVYFGSSTAGFFLDPEDGQLKLMGRRQGLTSEAMIALLTDRESNVWIGGLRGLSRVAGRRFESYDRDYGLLEDEVTAITETESGILVAGHNTGFTFLDGDRTATLSFDHPKAPILDRRVLDLAVDRDGTIWAAAQKGGLMRVTSEPSLERVLADESVQSVEVDRQGVLYVGTRGRLLRRQGSRFLPVDIGSEAAPESFRWLHADDEGRLFAAGRGSLRWHDGDTWKLAAPGPTPRTNNIFNVYAEPAGRVWIGTSGGLCHLERGEIVETRLDGLSIDDPVYLILRDPQGRMWFGTDDGVVVWDRRQARRLKVRDGLAGRETNRGAGWVDRLGRVWIGTDHGMSMYRQSYDERSDLPPPVVEIRNVEVDGEARSAGTRLDLSYRERHLTFHFSAVSLSASDDLRYRYRLDGFEDRWIGPTPLTSMRARYTNLRPGRYRFRIAAGWVDGAWSPEAVSELIFIAPPFWFRPWFIGLAVAALGLGIPALVRLRTQAIRGRNAELEELTRQLSAHIEERESLISELETKNEELERYAYLVSHDLKGPLVTIKGFLGYVDHYAKQGDYEKVRADVARISTAAETMVHLLDDLLELSRLGHVLHQPETLSLTEVAHEAAALVAQQIADRGASVEISPELPTLFADRIRILEVMQNLIENAVKFSGSQNRPEVEIGVRQEEPIPVIYVRDNGIGIEPDFHDQIFGLFSRLDPSVQGTGVGLALVRRIIAAHGGSIWVESEGAGRGTTICFTIPGRPPEPPEGRARAS